MGPPKCPSAPGRHRPGEFLPAAPDLGVTAHSSVSRTARLRIDTPRRVFGHGLRPPDTRCGRVDSQDLSGPRLRNLGDLLHATPLRQDHEQRTLVRASERAGETAAVELDRLQHCPSFADTYATLVGYVSVPAGVLRIDADPVRHAAAEVGPHARVPEASVWGDLRRSVSGRGTRRRSTWRFGRHSDAIRKDHQRRCDA